MGKSVKVQERTVEAAIQKGLAELGAARDQVEIVLLSGAGEELDNQVSVQLTVREDADFAPMSMPPGVSRPPGETLVASSGLEVGVLAVSESALLTATDTPQIAQQVLETLLRGMGIRSQVVIRPSEGDEDGPDFILDIVGADLGILIGRRGETLRDLEYLTRLIVAQKIKRPQRFAVDVEGYRTRREQGLRELAKRMADRVRQNRQPITLEAMPPHERRIVHITLREHPTVRTQSIGEGERRRVMILPK